MLVVDLAGHVDAGDVAAAHEALRRLPVPTIGVGRAASPAAVALDERFDVRLPDASGLPPLLAAVRASPQAAAALVQVLRHSERLDVHEALIAESLTYSMLQTGPEFGAWCEGRTPGAARAPNPEPAVLARREGARLDLCLNRPERHNAFSSEMRDALAEALRVAAADPSVREITLRGAGDSFSAGGDLAEFGTLPDPATAHAVRSSRNASRLLADCAERVTAHVHGACIGAGVELPAFCGHVIAREAAFFQLPELAMGLVPGAGGTVSLPRRIGRQRTAWLALTGERLDVETALAWGLVDAIA